MRTEMEESIATALVILAAMGKVTLHTAMYRSKDALAALQLLPRCHADTGWGYVHQARYSNTPTLLKGTPIYLNGTPIYLNGTPTYLNGIPIYLSKRHSVSCNQRHR